MQTAVNHPPDGAGGSGCHWPRWNSVALRFHGPDQCWRMNWTTNVPCILWRKAAVICWDIAGCWVIFDEGHITNIAVDPDHRGRGVGRMLMSALLEGLAGAGATSATLEVRRGNQAAISLYRSFRLQPSTDCAGGITRTIRKMPS